VPHRAATIPLDQRASATQQHTQADGPDVDFGTAAFVAAVAAIDRNRHRVREEKLAIDAIFRAVIAAVEIGMGDDPDRELRAAVRLPMQWSNKANGGFSAAPLEYLRYPPLKIGEYGYKKVNVEDQKKDKDSLYHFMCQLIRRRKEHPQIGTAEWEQISTEFSGLLLLKYGKGEDALLIALNLASKKTAFSMEEAGISGTIEDILSESDYKKSGDKIAVNGYGFRWMKLDKQ
jgi:maltose alpha-D-glucosyltransferase / alpha-amylase